MQFSKYVTLTGSVQWMCKEILSRDTKKQSIKNQKMKMADFSSVDWVWEWL